MLPLCLLTIISARRRRLTAFVSQSPTRPGLHTVTQHEAVGDLRLRHTQAGHGTEVVHGVASSPRLLAETPGNLCSLAQQPR